MSRELRAWVSHQLKERRWSQQELAKQSGISQPLISQNLAGDVSPSADFCIKIALAFKEPPEKILRLAGILPSAAEDDILQELIEVARGLSPEDRVEVLKYAKFRSQQRQG